MSLADFINGAFEMSGGFFVALSVAKLHREKLVRGVAWQGVAFFTAWGFWNLFYYPSLGQWASFVGGLSIVAVNAVWLCQIAYYTARPGERPDPLEPVRPSGGYEPLPRTEKFRWSDK